MKVRGPPQSGQLAFFFLEDLLAMLDQVLLEVCPGMVLERHVLSAAQLSQHAPSVYAWTPAHAHAALLKGGVEAALTNGVTKAEEPVLDTICFGSQEVRRPPGTEGC